MVGCTFYGDLLGTSNYYRIDTSIAVDKLKSFYQETYNTFSPIVDIDQHLRINLFSDSLFITGDNHLDILKGLSKLYLNLLNKDLLLRGAIVKGKLDYKPLFTIPEIGKQLPEGDVLVRATSLEHKYKGARLLIENELATQLFSDCTSWKTHEGYLNTIQRTPVDEDCLRKICLTPDNENYEMLYYWQDIHQPIVSKDYERVISRLTNTMKMCNRKVKPQYSETINLIRRSAHRSKLTQNVNDD